MIFHMEVALSPIRMFSVRRTEHRDEIVEASSVYTQHKETQTTNLKDGRSTTNPPPQIMFHSPITS